MRKYLFCEAGFVEKANWQPNCWINIECPDAADFHFLQEQLKVPQSFLNDIADTDERPRTDTEGNWLLTICLAMQSKGRLFIKKRMYPQYSAVLCEHSIYFS